MRQCFVCVYGLLLGGRGNINLDEDSNRGLHGARWLHRHLHLDSLYSSRWRSPFAL